jgi:pSer/pThr/pTyr-binding forkhead associated (FHA) protein
MTDGNESTQILTAQPTAAQPWHAGADLTRQEACPHCQATVPSGEEFCPKCGYQRGTWQGAGADAAATATVSAASPATALILRARDGRVFGLPEGQTVAGRGEVPLRLDDGFISRQHARFDVQGETVTLTDLGSSNGTFVGERRLEPQAATPLEIGGPLRLGQLELTLERNASATSAAGDSTALLQQPAAIVSEQPAADSGNEEPSKSTPPANWSGWALTGGDGVNLNLPSGHTSLGRKPDLNDLIIPDGYISGRHCAFDADGTLLTVTDVGSTNGTFVNGARLEANAAHDLKPGDSLRLGQLDLTVEFSGVKSPAEAELAATDAAGGVEPSPALEAEPA